MYKKKNPKTPSDYETLRIRIPPGMEKEKLKIMKKVEAIRKKLNKTKDENRKVWMGNHVLLEAIEIGLKDLENRKS